MTIKRRRLINFDACSVALFASLALGGAPGMARSQAAPPAVRTVPSPLPPSPAAPPGPRREPRVTPDGSISSPGFDERLK